MPLWESDMTAVEAQQLVNDLRKRMDDEGVPMKSGHPVLTPEQLDEALALVQAGKPPVLVVGNRHHVDGIQTITVDLGIDTVFHNLVLKYGLVEPDKGEHVVDAVILNRATGQPRPRPVRPPALDEQDLVHPTCCSIGQQAIYSYLSVSADSWYMRVESGDQNICFCPFCGTALPEIK